MKCQNNRSITACGLFTQSLRKEMSSRQCGKYCCVNKQDICVNIHLYEHSKLPNIMEITYLCPLEKQWANPGLFFFFFVFSNFTTNMYVKKCPSSIWCWDSNSRPLEHESPITTRPGLPPREKMLPHQYLVIFISIDDESRQVQRPQAVYAQVPTVHESRWTMT